MLTDIIKDKMICGNENNSAVFDYRYCCFAPDCSGSSEAAKAIFPCCGKATKGSYCEDFGEKDFVTRATA